MIQSALIVDDDPVFRNTLQRALEKRSMKTLVAESPRDAVELFREHRSDLVLLDYRMPERDGLSLLREMCSYNPGSVFIVLTGFGSIQLAVETMKQGADSFLTKPCDADSILLEGNKIHEKKKQGVPGIEKWEQRFYNLDMLERTGIEKALDATGGNISKAAQLLGIDRRTLQRKMKRFFLMPLAVGTALLSGIGYCLPECWAGGDGGAPGIASDHNPQQDRARFISLTGDVDYADERSAWDKTYSREEYVFGKEPTRFLADNIFRLPKGKVLDIAMGEGRNAVFFAKKGFFVEGVDISRVGIRKAQALAAENGVKIETINADLNDYRIKPETYSVIASFYYYQPSLFNQIKAGLQPGGMLIYESYTVAQLKNKGKEKWPEKYLLKPGELKNAFSDFEIIHYSEADDGKAAVARLIARRPKNWTPPPSP